jgi:hypothetical protein
MMKSRIVTATLLLTLLAGGQAWASGAPPVYSVALETGAAWSSRNDVRIPSEGGTQFDLLELIGTGPDPYVRLHATWQLAPRHGLRLTLAPLEISGSGTLNQPVQFAGASFAAGPTDATYMFNTYRLTYRYTMKETDEWLWRLGVTGLVRDAEIELRQGAVTAKDSDVGFVPLLHLSAERRLGERWRLLADFDGLASGQGRALDLAVTLGYDLNRDWFTEFGYRVLEGGADNDSVYSFAAFHHAVFKIGLRY